MSAPITSPDGFVEFKKEEIEQSVPARFEQQVERFPDRIALKTSQQVFTYRALNQEANRVARAILHARGSIEEPVALLFGHGAGMAAALLGVSKAGKIVVPLDPSDPQARLSAMFEDSQARLIVTHSESRPLAERLAGPGIALLDIDALDPELSTEDLDAPILPDRLFRIGYTSGSTGEPKGVVEDHRNFLHAVMRYTNALCISSRDRIGLLASYTSNAGFSDTFRALLNGAASLPFDIRRDGLVGLAEWLIREEITIYHSTSSVFRHFCETLSGTERFPNLRLIHLGGEPVSRPDVELYQRYFPPTCVLLNNLGGTETGACRQYLINKDTPIPGSVVPVGYAVDDMDVLLLDDAGREVGVDEIGEIAVKSRYLALGYWRRPELTSEKFRPAPDGERIYLTGDLGRMRPDGCLVHVGRKDSQVKIRGYRIELGEIEAILNTHPAVRASVVLAEDGGHGESRLASYVVLVSREAPTARELRLHLRRKLPEHMVPASFSFLDALPLTPNGKVDRRALRGLAGRPAPDDGDFDAPRNSVEESLASIWAGVLRCERIGIHASFFDLGGHSLTATQLISSVRQAFEVDVPLRAFLERPTIEALAALIELRRRDGGRVSATMVTPVSREGDLPLSFAQQRLWFHDQLVPGNPFYNVGPALRIKGALDVRALERSLGEIVRRHETLRTTFRTVEGRPVQRIAPDHHVRLPVVDLEGLDPSVRESEARRLVNEEAERPFDLSNGPLFRPMLFRLRGEEHVLLISIHHIASDAWSREVLLKELSALYEAFAAGQPSRLEPLPIQYADFAQWQREWLSGDELDRQLTYWKRQLDGLSPLKLPTDRPRPAALSYRGARAPFRLGATLTEALRALGRSEGATLFMTLLAAFQVLLSRYTGQDDIAVGTPIANRNRAEIEGLIGFFVNSLVLRTNLSGDPTFRELLGRVREMALGAYAHQDLPFEKLIEEMEPERHLNRNPLVQVMFTLRNDPERVPELKAVTVSPFLIDRTISRFDLVTDLWESADALAGTIVYSTDLFEAATVARMIERFGVLLESIVAAPGLRVSELEIIPSAERRQLLVEWNQTRADYPSESTLPELFEAQVERSPDAIAVVFEDQRLTYRELNRRANQLARHLAARGIGPGALVGVAMERSPGMIVGLLGILKAGAAYLPMDLTHPRERLRFIFDDSRIRVLLTHERLRSSFRESMAEVIAVDAWEKIAKEPDDNPGTPVTPEHSAYVIYTSGSTGVPNGVVITHRSLVNYLWHLNTALRDVVRGVPLISALTFDASLKQLFAPLLRGDKVWVLPDEIATEPDRLLRALAGKERVGLNCVPSLWNALLDLLEVSPGVPSLSLTHLLLGGERLQRELVERTLQRLPHLEIWNFYGPTEATANSTIGQVVSAKEISIGRPIANTQTYVLDKNRKPVPIGISGELYIGGAGLARGYLNRPELTAERFIPHPFSNEPGARLYRTGDLVRWQPDGALEFLGRIDHQVKIRGFRVELGEIEAVLGQHSDVRDAVLLAREETSGERRLVAYVVPKAETGEADDQKAHAVDQVNRWQEVFDGSHQQAATVADPTFNISGWNESYTGAPIPAEEMREWVEETVKRILTVRPSEVLEIGCGTGLLLFRIAPRCRRYVGTDFSSVVLNNLRGHLDRLGAQREVVTLLERAAEDFEGFNVRSFDTVILNSVVQYFPSVEYLLSVLRGAVRVLRPGGWIVLGDVRSLPLLEAFHASVEYANAPESLTRAQLRERVARRAAEEEELVLDPGLFRALGETWGEISEVRVQPKRGKARNELNRFRYDVLLRVGGERPAPRTLAWEDWQASEWTVEKLREQLREAKPEVLALTHVPDARVRADVELAEWLRSEEGPESVGAYRGKREPRESAGVDPEKLWALGEEYQYTVEIHRAHSREDGRYDVVLQCVRRDRPRGRGAPVFPWMTSEPARAWNAYANDPLSGKRARSQARRLVPELRRFVEARLPGYMVPAAFVVLSSLPLTTNGKVDRRALPPPDGARPELAEAYVAPRTPVETEIAEIWRDLLGVERVGVEDNFFELGGHSLLATQVVSRMRETFEIDLMLRRIFEAPTVAGLAALISQDPRQRQRVEKTAELLARLDRLSDDEVQAMLDQRSAVTEGRNG